ncbi:N-acetyltransferase [Sporolactobacillus sp. THM7-4]|nr:N-acetyltransferase [Sporolactobacillus sp. THM7-4]
MLVSKRLYAKLIEKNQLDELYQIYKSNKEYLQFTEGTSDGVGVYTKEQMLRDFQLAELMGRKTLGIFLRDNMKIVGVMDYMEKAQDDKPWIGLIMIHGEYQRNGYGSEFLKALLQWGQSEGWQEIRISVIENNYASLNFLKKAGFKPFSTKEKRTPAGNKKIIYLKFLLSAW